MSTGARQSQTPGRGSIHSLFAGLVDDAAVFPPGSAAPAEAVVGHRAHRQAWYASLVGPLMLPTSMVLSGAMAGLLDPDDPIMVGLVADGGLARVPEACQVLATVGARVGQVEVAVAKRGEDPLPGLVELVEFGSRHSGLDLYAEIPLTWGLLDALDAVARARQSGARVTAKFRTGGLAAELFPSPVELAGVIGACRDRGIPFKLTAGLHRGVRHHDAETGIVHHGFINILAAAVAAAAAADITELGHRLASTDPIALVELVAPHRDEPRPLWTSFGSCSIAEPLDELDALGLLEPLDRWR